MILAIIYAILSGVTVVISRCVNSCLSLKTDPYQSTFFNYFVGFITSIFLCFFIDTKMNISSDIFLTFNNLTMLFGGVIGVINILILNIIVKKIAPVQLTLITFIAQSLTGVIIDYFIFDIFSFKILSGCIIIIIGLITYNDLSNS